MQTIPQGHGKASAKTPSKLQSDEAGRLDHDKAASIAIQAKPAGQRLLRRYDAAIYLQTEWALSTTAQSLAKLAHTGGGPVYQKMGKHPVYTRINLDAWAESKLSPPMRSTSDKAA